MTLDLSGYKPALLRFADQIALSATWQAVTGTTSQEDARAKVFVLGFEVDPDDETNSMEALLPFAIVRSEDESVEVTSEPGFTNETGGLAVQFFLPQDLRDRFLNREGWRPSEVTAQTLNWGAGEVLEVTSRIGHEVLHLSQDGGQMALNSWDWQPPRAADDFRSEEFWVRTASVTYGVS